MTVYTPPNDTTNTPQPPNMVAVPEHLFDIWRRTTQAVLYKIKGDPILCNEILANLIPEVKRFKDITPEYKVKQAIATNLALLTNLLHGPSPQKATTTVKPALSPYEREKRAIEERINAMRRVYPKTDDWGRIIGLDLVKQVFDEEILLSEKTRNHLHKQNIPIPQRVLLFGPPGCGKTLLVQAIAQKAGLPLYNVTPAKLLSKWHGESEKSVARLFEKAYHEETDGCILFFDEFDGLAGGKGDSTPESMIRIQKALLSCIDGIDVPTPNKVIIIATVNRPDKLDDAMIRRFDRRLFIPPPDNHTIGGIIKSLYPAIKLEHPDVQRLISNMGGLLTKEVENVVAKALIQCTLAGTRDRGYYFLSQADKFLNQMTPHFCTFKGLDPRICLFYARQYGFPKINTAGLWWVDRIIERRKALMQRHPNHKWLFQEFYKAI